MVERVHGKLKWEGCETVPYVGIDLQAHLKVREVFGSGQQCLRESAVGGGGR